MRLVLVGPPGSGKGTQARLLTERHGLASYGTGDILRDAVRRGTPQGRLAEPLIRKGQLAPDSLVNELVSDLFNCKSRPERTGTRGPWPRPSGSTTSWGSSACP
jgi:adenylate kinase